MIALNFFVAIVMKTYENISIGDEGKVKLSNI